MPINKDQFNGSIHLFCIWRCIEITGHQLYSPYIFLHRRKWGNKVEMESLASCVCTGFSPCWILFISLVLPESKVGSGPLTPCFLNFFLMLPGPRHSWWNKYDRAKQRSIWRGRTGANKSSMGHKKRDDEEEAFRSDTRRYQNIIMHISSSRNHLYISLRFWACGFSCLTFHCDFFSIGCYQNLFIHWQSVDQMSFIWYLPFTDWLVPFFLPLYLKCLPCFTSLKK
jgi:hypothetical protein